MSDRCGTVPVSARQFGQSVPQQAGARDRRPHGDEAQVSHTLLPVDPAKSVQPQNSLPAPLQPAGQPRLPHPGHLGIHSGKLQAPDEHARQHRAEDGLPIFSVRCVEEPSLLSHLPCNSPYTSCLLAMELYHMSSEQFPTLLREKNKKAVATAGMEYRSDMM